MRIPELTDFEGLEARAHAFGELGNGNAVLARLGHFRTNEIVGSRRSCRGLARTAAAALRGRLSLAAFSGLTCRLSLSLAGAVRLVGSLRLVSLVISSSRLILSRGGRLFLARPIALGRFSPTSCRILSPRLFGLRGVSRIGGSLLLPCGRIAGLTLLIGRRHLRIGGLRDFLPLSIDCLISLRIGRFTLVSARNLG